MATIIEQQTALDESLVPSSQRLRIGRSNFRLPSDIQSKEATLQVVYDLNFITDTRKSVLDLEAFREMLHISPRIPNQPFADLPTEEEVLKFLRFLGHSHDIRYLTDVNVNKLYHPWRSFASVINKCLAGKSSGVTQQYGAILPIELTTAEIRNSKAYQEYHACAMGEAAPKPKASARKKKGDCKQPLRATNLVEPTDLQITEAEQLKIVLKRSRQETHISQQSGSGTGEGTEVGSHEDGKESDDDSDDGSDKDSDETVKSGAEDKETGKGGDEVRESEGESEEEEGSFDPIPRTPKDSEKERDDEEEQESRLSEEARIQEEEDAEELYRDVNINPRRGLQVTQNIEDTHVILTPVNPDDPQESSSMSSFVSSMLNPLSDEGVESIFTTTSSQSVSLVPPTPILTPSTITTITLLGEAPIPPPTIPSIILENLLTFNSAFCFEERL
nr:hypothetical protein [Tanacetum cinerariifolium]